MSRWLGNIPGWGNQSSASAAQPTVDLKDLFVLHLRYDELDQSFDGFVDVRGIESVRDAGPKQLSLRTGREIEIGFYAHLLLFLQVAGSIDDRVQSAIVTIEGVVVRKRHQVGDTRAIGNCIFHLDQARNNHS